MGFEHQLQFIKETQREYKRRFGEELKVDFPSMKGIIEAAEFISARPSPSDIESFLKDCVERHQANLEIILNPKIRLSSSYPKEVSAITEFCRKVLSAKWSVKQSAALLKRHRAVVYHFGKKRKL